MAKKNALSIHLACFSTYSVHLTSLFRVCLSSLGLYPLRSISLTHSQNAVEKKFCPDPPGSARNPTYGVRKICARFRTGPPGSAWLRPAPPNIGAWPPARGELHGGVLVPNPHICNTREDQHIMLCKRTGGISLGDTIWEGVQGGETEKVRGTAREKKGNYQNSLGSMVQKNPVDWDRFL